MYQYTGLNLYFSPNRLSINRQTYSILDWLGDMGGLMDALVILGQILIMPISSFTLKSNLLQTLFRHKKSDKTAINNIQ